MGQMFGRFIYFFFLEIALEGLNSLNILKRDIYTLTLEHAGDTE